MRRFQNELILSAGDLVGHLNCRHLTSQDLQVADGKLEAPKQFDPLLDILRERGQKHEDAYLDHLVLSGHQSTKIDGFGIDDDSVTATLAAMRNGADIVVQAALRAGRRWLKPPQVAVTSSACIPSRWRIATAQTISSRCHRGDGFGLSFLRRLAISGPDRMVQQRMVS